MNPLGKLIRVAFRCCVVEGLAPCNVITEERLTTFEIREYDSSRYICKQHLDRGYRWLTDILGDQKVTIEDLAHYENRDGQWKLVGDEETGTRNDDLYTRPAHHISGGWGDVGAEATGARVQDMTPVQKETSNKGKQVLKGWGVVLKFDDDTLMIPLEETVNPELGTVERKIKSVFAGFAVPPKPKDGDPI